MRGDAHDRSATCRAAAARTAGAARSAARHLDTLLLARAPNSAPTVLQPWAVRRIDGATVTGIAVHARDERAGESATCARAVLIDAHGSWERVAVRARLRVARSAARSDLFAFKANFRDADLGRGLLPGARLRRRLRRHGASPTAASATVACCIRRDRLRGCRLAMPGVRAGDAVEACCERSAAACAMRCDGAARDGPWLAAGPHPSRRSATAGRRGCFAIGNAAGEAHPIIGEGISMAMQGAWLLCARLEAQRDAPLRARARSRRRATTNATGGARSARASAWAALFAALRDAAARRARCSGAQSAGPGC